MTSTKNYVRPASKLTWDIFYKIDTNIFAPAIVSINNAKTDKTFKAGSLDVDVMKRSLGLT